MGWVLTLLFIPRLADIYGRKMVIMCGNIVSILAFGAIITATNYNMLIVSILVFGMMSTVRVQVSIVYIYELVMKKNWTPAVTAMSVIFDGPAGLFAAIYFSYISNDQHWIMLACFSCSLIGAIIVAFLPESPCFLISSGKLGEAQQAFERIAKINGANTDLVSLDRIKATFMPH